MLQFWELEVVIQLGGLTMVLPGQDLSSQRPLQVPETAKNVGLAEPVLLPLVETPSFLVVRPRLVVPSERPLQVPETSKNVGLAEPLLLLLEESPSFLVV